MREKIKELRPLYLEITEDFEFRIKRGEYKPGEKLPSVDELCVKRGVHKNTVKSAFKSLRERGLVRNHSGVGIVVREDLKFPLKFALILPETYCGMEDLIFGLSRSMKGRDVFWEILFYGNPDEQSGHLRMLAAKDLSGAVLRPDFSGSGYSEICKIQNEEFPLVLIENFYQDSKGVHVDAGAFEAAREAVNRMNRIRRFTIGLVCNDDKFGESFLEGYKDAHWELKLDCRRNYIKRIESDESSGEVSLELMKLKNPPASIVYTNPIAATNGCKALKEANVNLKSIKLVSFGKILNNELFENPIICIKRDFKELGERAGKLLLERIQAPP
jgi:DNA-binding LacI/PurR family transcriptional regulator